MNQLIKLIESALDPIYEYSDLRMLLYSNQIHYFHHVDLMVDLSKRPYFIFAISKLAAWRDRKKKNK